LTTLQDYRIESGKPSGELKITEVPEVTGKRNGESRGKGREAKRDIRMAAIFYGREQIPADELKGIRCPQGQQNSSLPQMLRCLGLRR
jgi:hypothetical protein